MGWQGTNMLTNGEHDELWRNGAIAIPNICRVLDRANAIACAKELYELGELSKEGYIELMTTLFEKSGWTLNKNNKK